MGNVADNFARQVGRDLVLAAETEQIVLRIEPHRTVKDQRNELSGLERVDPERTSIQLSYGNIFKIYSILGLY